MMSAPAELRNVSANSGKVSLNDPYDNTVVIPPMPDYSGRILAYTATSLVIATGVFQDCFVHWLLWLVATGMVWPHVAHYITRRTFLKNSPRIRQKMLLLDCVFGGFLIGAIAS